MKIDDFLPIPQNFKQKGKLSEKSFVKELIFEDPISKKQIIQFQDVYGRVYERMLVTKEGNGWAISINVNSIWLLGIEKSRAEFLMIIGRTYDDN